MASFTADAILKGPPLMINEVTISNFKGIKDCEIKNIGKVNLFIGKNDCGKSSIFEAIYFTCKESIGPNLRTCIGRRGQRGNISSRELWYGYNTDPVIEIALNFENNSKVRMTINRGETRILTILGISSPSVNWSQVVTEYNFPTFSTNRRHNIPQPFPVEIMHYVNYALLLDPTSTKYVTAMEKSYLNKIKLSGEDTDLANRNADIYGKEPRWEFVPHPDFPDESRVILYENGKRIFLDDFGDGPRYGLAICSSAKTINDTALFIEEIESHQHPASLKKLIKHLIEISKDNNLQLFITTHSPQTFRALYYYYETPGERKKDFRCFHVIRDVKSGEVTAKVEEDYTTISRDIFEVEQDS